MAMDRVFVLAELNGSEVAAVTLELLTKARNLGAKVEAVAIGASGESVSAKLGEYGATTVYAAAADGLEKVLSGAVIADAIATLIQEQKPGCVLIGNTYTGRDVAGRLAVKLDCSVVTNAIDVEAEGDGVAVKSAIFGATQNVTTKFSGKAPALVLIRAKSVAAEPGGGASPNVVEFNAEVGDKHRRARLLERVADAGTGPKLEEAPVVISGGRGLGDPKNFALLDQLAELVHGAVGASRAVVDAGWVPYAMQVGQTGKTVKPTVYIACGISGAMQHTVGMKGAKNIVAINKDRDAPIFKLADLGVVGDALKILPQVIDELQARKS